MKTRVFAYFSSVVIFCFVAVNACYSSVDKTTMIARKCYRLLRFYEEKYKIPRDTLFAIAMQESGVSHPIHGKQIMSPWTVNIEGNGYSFNSKREAVNFVKKQMKSGKRSIDVGLMQINILHHPHAFESIEHAFDIRANIEYAAYFLVSKYNQLGNWSKAISHYHSATDHLGSKYRASISKIANKIEDHKMTLTYKSHPKYSVLNNKNQSDSGVTIAHYDKKNAPEILKLNPRKNKVKNSSRVD